MITKTAQSLSLGKMTQKYWDSLPEDKKFLHPPDGADYWTVLKDKKVVGLLGAAQRGDKAFSQVYIDSAHRGQGLLKDFYAVFRKKYPDAERIAAVDLTNAASLKAHGKLFDVGDINGRKAFFKLAGYEFSSTQLNLDPIEAIQVKALGQQIADADLYTTEDSSEAYDGYGREQKPHITVCYGLHDKDPDKVIDLVRNFGPIEVTTGEISAFSSNDAYDVLKIDVEGKKLHQLHALIRKNLDVTSSYRVYSPHITIAYVKKDTADSYIKTLEFAPRKLRFEHLEFSSPDSARTKVEL